MQQHQREFLELAIEFGALKFGEFTLKSGRVSPYFFNAGQFSTGGAMAGLARCFAHTIVAAELEFDMLFGPAYKGIPLATATAVALRNITAGTCPSRTTARRSSPTAKAATLSALGWLAGCSLSMT